MGRIIVTEFISLDGVVEAPGGEPGHRHTGWVLHFQDDAQYQHSFDEVRASEALLLGRKTYESFAGAWPTYTGDFADKMNQMPKFVASTTLTSLDWENSTLLSGDFIEAIEALKRDIPGDILVTGSRTLVASLKLHHLIDEYRLMLFPIILGSGFRLFDDSLEATKLSLTGLKTLPSGAVVLIYQPTEVLAGSDS